MWERETVNLEKPRDRYASPDFYFGSGDQGKLSEEVIFQQIKSLTDEKE